MLKLCVFDACSRVIAAPASRLGPPTCQALTRRRAGWQRR